MARKLQLDAIDIAIRQTVKEQPGCSISEAIDAHRIELSETPLRWRVGQMIRHGLIRMEKTKREARLYHVDGKGDAL